MPVIINRKSLPVVEVNPPEVPVTPIEIEPKAPRSETGIPRGRSYLRTKRSQPTPPKPKKTLDQTLPRVYNAFNPKKDFEDSSLAYYSNYKCVDCKDTRKILVYDTCDSCEGEGCPKCHKTGEIKNYIPCQACNSNSISNKIR